MSEKPTLIIELFGLPRTGKTTISRILRKSLLEKGFNPHVVTERASVCPIRDKLHPFFNLWTSMALIKEYVEVWEQGYDVVIADRGLMDALVWIETFNDHEKYALVQQVVHSLLNSQLIHLSLLCGYYMYAEIDTVLEREERHMVQPRKGRILNEKTLARYREAFEVVKMSFPAPVLQLDTTATSIRESLKQIESDLLHRLL